MANSIDAQNPIICDTAGELKPDGVLYPKSIVWTDIDGNEIGDNEDLLLKDNDEVVLFCTRSAAAGDGTIFYFPKNFKCNGLTMTTIDGGVAYIYL